MQPPPSFLAAGDAAPWLMPHPSSRLIPKRIMSSEPSPFADESLLLPPTGSSWDAEPSWAESSSSWDCDACAPPAFDLPPPPRPPWLEDLDNCVEAPTRSQMLEQLDTCDNTLISNSKSVFEDTFHSAAVILVCSIVLVIILLVIGVFLFKRRKNLLSYHQHPDECHPSSETMVPSSSSDGQLHQQQQQQQLYFNQLQNSMKQSAMRRSSASMGHFPNTLSLPNHYIPDSDKQRLTGSATTSRPSLPSSRIGRADPDLISEEFRQRFPLSERPRNLMELTTRPPAHIYHNYPHIIIGGQPFYLIPSDPSQAEAFEIDSYAYPQCVPIYEEIDNKCPSECSASDQGEIGSLRRDEPPVMMNRQHSVHARPVTSHSQHTNSSELSSSESGGSHHRRSPPPLVPTRPVSTRILVNPLVRDVAFQDTSFSDSYESTSSGSGNKHFAPIRTTSFRNKSPQSLMSAKFPHRSPGNSSSSQTSSIYYYSDTLRKKDPDVKLPFDVSDDVSDSGVSMTKNSSEASNNLSANALPVDTKVVLDVDFEFAGTEKLLSSNNASQV